MKPIPCFLFLGIAFSCTPAKTNEGSVDSTAVEKPHTSDKHKLTTCLDVVTEILETSPVYQSKITEERIAAIEKNGGSLAMELEGSPNPDDKPMAVSETYDFGIFESYEDRNTVIERFRFDPVNKQLFLYDPVEDALNPIDFNKELLQTLNERCGVQELPLIQAMGGKGTNVDWAAMKKEADAADDGPGFFEGDCKESVSPGSVSSTLASQGKNNYEIKNISDYNPMTAWVEGKSDYGIGEYFEVTGMNVNTIYNGYQSSPGSWKNNSRVKRFKVYKDNKPLCLLDLTDEMDVQMFELPRAEDDAGGSHTFRFEIVDVYKGLKYSDVAISEVMLTQCCMIGDTRILSSSDQTDIAAIEKGDVISGIDLVSGAVTNSEIVKVAKQTHLTVIRISTGAQQIEITPNHPLYLKGYGFISIERYMQSKGITSYQDLVNTIDVLTLHPDTGKQQYKTISRVEELHGVFETYSILKLSRGETYVANGFVTRTY
jgi:hypothetical protein